MHLQNEDGTWEDSNLIVSIAPTKIDGIYADGKSYNRTHRLKITTKYWPIIARYGEYTTTSIVPQFRSNTFIHVPVTEEKSVVTVVVNDKLYVLRYTINSANTIEYIVANGTQFPAMVNENISSPTKQYDYAVDGNKYIIGNLL